MADVLESAFSLRTKNHCTKYTHLQIIQVSLLFHESCNINMHTITKNIHHIKMYTIKRNNS